MKGPERTWNKLNGLERTWKNLKELKEVQDFEKCDWRQTDGVSDNASTREACASKKSNMGKVGNVLDYVRQLICGVYFSHIFVNPITPKVSYQWILPVGL